MVFGVGGSSGAIPVQSNPRWQPTAILENSNGDISAKGRPIHFIFVSMVGVRHRRIDWLDLVIYFRLNQIKKAAARHLGNFQMNIYLWNGLFDPLWWK